MKTAVPRLRPAVLVLAMFVVLVAWNPLSAEEDLIQLEEQAMKAAVAKIAPSVVRIDTIGGLQRVGRRLVGSGPTTGLVVSADGYIISSAFNFVQKPDSILVTLPSGSRLSAKIVARDHSRMLVLLKVHADSHLRVPRAVSRKEMQVGQWAIAVGRTYDASQPNLSIGIVSAVNRIWGKALQTDAKISPNNYGGPLVDIRGRVLGVLVPLSPQGQSELAGVEWYDSGIGFAIPLEDINRQLDKLKQGQDLHRGIVGISLKGTDLYSQPAVIAASRPNSPAAGAGLKAGDKIIEVEGVKIERQTQLKHQLGTRYAGERIRIVVLRGKQRIETVVELTDKLEPYEHPFLGILPMREITDQPEGLVVRYVYPASPADEAGVQAADRITSLAGKPVAGAPTMRELISILQVGEKIKLTVQRGGSTVNMEVTLSTLPIEIPPALPPAHPERQPVDGQHGPVGVVKMKLPEERNECFAYVPEGYDGVVPHGVVVWLHAPGEYHQDQLVARWKEHCQRNDLILLAPKAVHKDKWQRTEVQFIRKVLDNLLSNYKVDRSRIVLHGYQGGAVMAYLTAFAHRDLVRGVAAVDAALPRGLRPPNNEPLHRLAFYLTTSKSEDSERIENTVKSLEKMKFPVTVRDTGEGARQLSTEELSELIRWIDTLDRI